MWRYASLLAGGLLIFAGGCSSDLNFDKDMEDMVCDSTGCWHCDGGDCGEYRCDETHQCPIHTYCSSDRRCMPDDGSGNQTNWCTRHEDCSPGQICTLDGQCVTSPGGGPDTSGGADTYGGGTDTYGGGGDDTGGGVADTTGGGDDTGGGGDVGLPDHPDDACGQNKDCGVDGVCLNGGCYFPCALDSSCPPGQECTDGQCWPLTVPENTCTFNGECGGGHVCVEGTCFETCSETLDCPSHTKCVDGTCQQDTTPVIQCSGPASCSEGQGCVDGKCLDHCSPDVACGATEECIYGFCQAVPACFDTQQCGGSNCLDGQCQE